MGLVIGIIAVLLVLFLVFAMALAEWADKDVGEFFIYLFRRPSKRKIIPVSGEATADIALESRIKAEAKNKVETLKPAKSGAQKISARQRIAKRSRADKAPKIKSPKRKRI